MKKRGILSLAFVILFTGIACAAPYLWSDTAQYPSTQALTFQCKFDNTSYTPATSETAGGFIYIKHDLSGIANGNHTVVCQTCNVWGCSVDSLPFGFAKQVTSMPTNLRIQ